MFSNVLQLGWNCNTFCLVPHMLHMINYNWHIEQLPVVLDNSSGFVRLVSVLIDIHVLKL